MITVINNFNESTDMYEGTLQEAAEQFILEANQLVNDFSMDLLLTEHKYLYEHGEQLDWMTEADENGGGLKLTARIKALFDGAVTLFRKIYNNIVAFVTEKISQVSTFFKSIGLDRKKVNGAFANYDKPLDAPKFLEKESFLDDVVNAAEQKYAKQKDIKDGKDDFITKPGEFFAEYSSDFEDKENANKSDVARSVGKLLFDSKGVLKPAKDAYNGAMSSLKEGKAIASGDLKDSDDIAEMLSRYRAAVMHNSYILRDISKVYAFAMRGAIRVAKQVVNADKGNKYSTSSTKVNGKEVLKSAVRQSKGSPNSAYQDEEVGQESANLVNDASDYIQGCLEGRYKLDEELFNECSAVVLEAAKANAAPKKTKFFKV